MKPPRAQACLVTEADFPDHEVRREALPHPGRSQVIRAAASAVLRNAAQLPECAFIKKRQNIYLTFRAFCSIRAQIAWHNIPSSIFSVIFLLVFFSLIFIQRRVKLKDTAFNIGEIRSGIGIYDPVSLYYIVTYFHLQK